MSDKGFLYENQKDPDDQFIFIPHRVFMNRVDSFNARYIASYLTDQFYGASRAISGEEEQVEEEETNSAGPVSGERYEVVGTTLPLQSVTEDISLVIDENDTMTFVNEILKCGFIIYDITTDPSEIVKVHDTLKILEEAIKSIQELGPKTYEHYPIVRTFILISTIMTWGASKPIDADDPTAPFTENDYRKRRPHPNFKEHIACERDVILAGKKFKDKVKTYVICSGIPYGMEEDQLNFHFRMAWRNEKILPIFKTGNNVVPFIHIKDLAKVVHGVCEMQPKKPHYILAVEQQPCRIKNVITCMSKLLGQGRTKEVTEAEAFLYPGITQTVFDICTVNLHMEPGYIQEELAIRWQSKANIVENMRNIIDEFRTYNNLNPVRVLLHGPPASGKTMLAKRLCDHYGFKYMSVKTIIDEKLEHLRLQIKIENERRAKKEQLEKARTDAAEYEEEMATELGEEDEEEIDILGIEEELKEIENALFYSSSGRLPDDYVIKLVKDALKDNACQNQGYILDGYPKTIEQAKEIFGSPEEILGEAEEEEEDMGKPIKVIPDFVISLVATDEFLCNRIMEKREEEIQGTHYDEENMLRRLAIFREHNTEDNTMLNFFDELEIHPKLIDVMNYSNDDIEPIYDIACFHLGKPAVFALSYEETMASKKLEMERNNLEAQSGKLAQEMREKQASQVYFDRMAQYSQLLENLQIEEEKILIAQSESLRAYLMKFVFPTLIKGLMETARLKPNDPVDFLAEFLFRSNPEGKMFDPSYSRKGILIEEAADLLKHEKGDGESLKRITFGNRSSANPSFTENNETETDSISFIV